MPSTPFTPLDEVVTFIHADPDHGIIAHARGDHVGRMRAQWDIFNPEDFTPGKLDLGRAFRRFAILTWPEAQRDAAKRFILDLSDEELGYLCLWDQRAELRRRFGDWAYDAAADRSYRFDVWQNLHLGFVGAAAGFPERVLCSGAGVPQLLAGKIPPGYLERLADRLYDASLFPPLPDPADCEAVHVGWALWRRHGERLAREDLVAALRTSAALATQPGRAA